MEMDHDEWVSFLKEVSRKNLNVAKAATRNMNLPPGLLEALVAVIVARTFQQFAEKGLISYQVVVDVLEHARRATDGSTTKTKD